MTFLVCDSQKSLFVLQKNQLTFEQMLIGNQVIWCQSEQNYINQKYSEMENKGENPGDPGDDPYFIQLQQMTEQLESRKANLDDQIALLNEEISSCKTLVNNNIKQSCGLNLLGS